MGCGAWEVMPMGRIGRSSKTPQRFCLHSFTRNDWTTPNMWVTHMPRWTQMIGDTLQVRRRLTHLHEKLPAEGQTEYFDFPLTWEIRISKTCAALALKFLVVNSPSVNLLNFCQSVNMCNHGWIGWVPCFCSPLRSCFPFLYPATRADQGRAEDGRAVTPCPIPQVA